MIVKLNIVVGVEIPDGSDPEHVAAQFDNGLLGALDGFPGGEIVGARVESASPATDEELQERGWTE